MTLRIQDTRSRDVQRCRKGIFSNSRCTLDSGFSQFTVVIVSFSRTDNLIKVASHLRKSNFVHEILIVWNNLEEPCPPVLYGLARCIQQEENLVHNRFAIWKGVHTEAVLHWCGHAVSSSLSYRCRSDDDVLVPLKDIEAAFKIWRSCL
jgi:hypothetical protein